MENKTGTTNPLFNSFRVALTYISISFFGFVILTLIALYVPNNLLLRSPESIRLKNWLPDKISFLQNMIFVSEYESNNKEIARNYPNQQEMLQLLETFGREESLTHLFVSKDRCTLSGARSVRMSVVLHSDITGARKYLEWLQEQDRSKAFIYKTVTVGDYGYIFSYEQKSECSEADVETYTEVFFQRNNALGSVSITSLVGSTGNDNWSNIALELADELDDRIQKETTSH